MITTRNVTKSYTDQNGTIAALGGINIKVARGDFVAVIGRSGAGKSTLLGVMGGLLKPSSGEVFLDGKSLWQLDERARARVRAQKIGFVFQNASVIRSLTVLENVLLPQIFLPKPVTTDLSRAMNLIELMGIENKAQAYTDQLSGGEKRRVAIASAMMNNPSLLLADEPTGDLDTETESEIMDTFLDLKSRGTTIVMVTHNYQLASYADRILEMDSGSIVEPSQPTEACESSDFSSLLPDMSQANTEKEPYF
ncbi:MAG: ABC transporter ATP-binding protein [Planctomycetota bacterium]|jgi:ABC-type lipoprotein export system ATPase subunit